jgi:hypothetical protein
MQARVVATVAAIWVLSVLAPPAAMAQTPPLITPAQIDQLVAPIALYPDPLLSQILMAASYPVEVVEADRWRQDPANTDLQGDDLAARLAAQTWDPSVKSLVPFPQVLAMMDANLVWTERLGEAFVAQPAEVMDEIQKLRRVASEDGRLGSSARETVSQADGAITIEPADPSDVGVPEYDPGVVYGTWPYPEYPPYYFPDYFSGCAIGEFGYCWTVWPIVLPLWGWSHCDWRHHRINVDHDHFARLDDKRSPRASGVWRRDFSHRLGATDQSAIARSRYAGAAGIESEPRPVHGYYPRPAPRAAAPAPRAQPAFGSYIASATFRAPSPLSEASRARPGVSGSPNFGSRGGGGVAASRGVAVAVATHR